MTEPTDDDYLESRLLGYLHRFTSYPRPRQSSLDTAPAAVQHRPRRLGLIAAVTVAALCVTGTATAALVVTLHGGGVNGAAVGSTAGSGHSIFIPFAGPASSANGNQGSGVGAAAPNAASTKGALAGPSEAGTGVSSFPGNYSSCAGGSAQVANGQIQVQAIATVGTADRAAVEQLTIQVSGSGATNKAAVTDAQAREVAVDNAVQAAGIDSASITVEPVEIGQNGYFYYTPAQSSKPSASGDITVSSTDPVQLGAAADAAVKAGGSQVSSYSSYGTQFSTPSSGDVAAALSDATGSAHDEAAAAASASGLHLGKVSGLVASPPSLCYGGSGESLVVTVTVNYSVSS